jgi:iron complex outermembrane receptor protein
MDLERDPSSNDVSSAASAQGSSPRHNVVVQSQLDLPGRFEFDQTYRFVSGLGAQRVGSYQTADVRLGWRPVSSFELSVTGKHLLQPHHAEYGGGAGGIVEIKRAIFGRLTFRW